MKNSQEILSSVLKTTQMGQLGIRSVLGRITDSSLKEAVRSQLREYDSIESEAHRIALKNGWNVPELHSGAKLMLGQMARLSMTAKNHDSRIAAMMLLGNANGIIKSAKCLHHSANPDTEVVALTNQLLETESANIAQMQKFL